MNSSILACTSRWLPISPSSWRMALAALFAASVLAGCKATCRPGQVLRDGLCHTVPGPAVDAGAERADDGGANASRDGGASEPRTESRRQGTTAADSGVHADESSDAAMGQRAGDIPERMDQDAGVSGTSTMPASAAVCGNGVREGMELCDGTDCKTECVSDNACVVARLEGAAKTCDAQCTSMEITACNSGDGCCPNGCDHGTDSDCSPSCGDGVLTGTETCEPGSSTYPCATPAACDDGDPCTEDTVTGNARQCSAKCAHVPIMSRASGDGCCPAGANIGNDSDCDAACGDGVMSSGETCDTGLSGSCPTVTTCERMGSGCMRGLLSGTGCNARCEMQTVTDRRDGDDCCPTGANIGNDSDCDAACGDGVISSGEACDTGRSGSCPTAMACERMGSGCMRGRVIGSGCDARCELQAITMAIDGDGCCPGLLHKEDSDCTLECRDPEDCATGESCSSEGKCKTGEPYQACSTNPECPMAAANCIDGVCTLPCSDETTDCPPAPAGLSNGCFSQVGSRSSQGFCRIRCRSDSACPEGGICTGQTTTTDGYCRGL
jgi:hypothetical protein